MFIWRKVTFEGNLESALTCFLGAVGKVLDIPVDIFPAYSAILRRVETPSRSPNLVVVDLEVEIVDCLGNAHLEAFRPISPIPGKFSTASRPVQVLEMTDFENVAVLREIFSPAMDPNWESKRAK